MKQFVIIGMGNFGRSMLEELSDLDAEVLIIDKDKELLNLYRDKVSDIHIADVMNKEVLQSIIPKNVDGVVIDVGDRIEASILATNHLKKMGIENIIVTAQNTEQGEILEIVGASRVVFPDQEAAKRIAPILISSDLFNYFPISADIVIAEVKLPKELVGKTLIEADIRRSWGVTVIAVRHGPEDSYQFFAPDYRMVENDIMLAAGSSEKIARFAGAPSFAPEQKNTPKKSIFRLLRGKH